MSSSKAAEVVDLEAIIERWAWVMFKESRTKDQGRIPKEHLQFTINWSRVRFVHHDPEFAEQKKPSHPQSHVLFRTRFANNTDREQEYAFKTERVTSSICEVFVERAVTLGCEMNLSLKTPCEIFEANAGFKRELSVTKAQGQVIEERLTWGVDSTIKVPAMHQTTAELIIFEDEFQGNFTVRSDVSGKVLVSVTNTRDNNCFLKSLSGDIDEIVGAEINGLKGFSVDRSNRMISFTTNGRCHFRYGVEQNIKLSQEKL